MSNAIAQSATVLAVSGNGETSYDFAARLSLIASRKAKGITRERQELNTNKLVTALCADYRAHFAAVYGKTERLPSEVFTQIEKAVFDHQNKVMGMITRDNVISFRRAFYHNSREMEITERLQAVGENKLSLQEQHLGISIMITAANKRLDDLMKKPTPDYDREKAVKEQIMKLTATQTFIEGEMKHQEKLLKEAQQK